MEHEHLEVDDSKSPPPKRGRPTGATNKKDWSQTIKEGTDRGTRSRSRSRPKKEINSNDLLGGAPSGIRSNIDDGGQSKRKREVTATKGAPNLPQINNLLTGNSHDNELCNETPLVPRKLDQPSFVECEGISQNLDPRSMANFLGMALKVKGGEIVESTRGNSDASSAELILSNFVQNHDNTADNVLAPPYNGLVCRSVNGKFIITPINCTGIATTKYGAALTTRPTQGLPRCRVCHNKRKNGRQVIKRIKESLDIETAVPDKAIEVIVKDERRAIHEIRTLRSEVQRLSNVERHLEELVRENDSMKVKIAKAESILNNEDRLDNLIVLKGTAADNMVQVVSLIDEAIDEAIKQDVQKNESEKIMWKIFLQRMLQTYAANGNTRMVKIHPSILDWSIVFCARTSKRIYNEVAKVMKLPNYSWVMKVSSKRVSTANTRAFSICTMTISEISKQREAENWSEVRACGFLAADAAAVSKGLQWNYTTKKLEGQSEDYKFQPLANKFSKMAEKLNTNSDTRKEGTSILENTPLAKDHCVCKWTSVDPNCKVSEVVASTNCETFNADVVFKMTELLSSTLPLYGLTALGISGDGASSNWRSFLAAATHTVASFLPKALMDKYPLIDFEIKILMKHPVTGNPFLFINDHMHLAKTNVNALENSSLKNSKRCLMYKKCPINLMMIKIAWMATGGATNQLQPTKLGDHSFNKGPRGRLDCGTAVGTISNSVADMLDAAVNDDTVSLHPYRNKNVFKPLIHYIRKWNELIDITNGRNEKYTPDNGNTIIEKLLTTLTWFWKWKNDHDKGVKDGEKTEYNFFADQTWFGIQNLILGHVFIIQHYCLGKGWTIDPLALSTDPVEHHFGQCRQFVGGSTDALTVQKFNAGDAKSKLAKRSNYDQVGNCKNAPVKGEMLPFQKRADRY